MASTETRSGARAVNAERARRGLPTLRIRLVPLRRGPDRLPLASRRIRAGAIDPEGRRRRPLRVGVVGLGVSGPGVSELVEGMWPGLSVRVDFEPDLARRGRGSVTALARARAGAALRGREFGLGFAELRSARPRQFAWAIATADGALRSGRRRGSLAEPASVERLLAGWARSWPIPR